MIKILAQYSQKILVFCDLIINIILLIFKHFKLFIKYNNLINSYIIEGYINIYIKTPK